MISAGRVGTHQPFIMLAIATKQAEKNARIRQKPGG
jgi:hypothetical protein